MTIDASLVSQLSMSGVYMLILFVSKETTVTIGRLGKQKFPRGYYSYAGSALGKGTGLKHRISRHLRKKKTAVLAHRLSSCRRKRVRGGCCSR